MLLSSWISKFNKHLFIIYESIFEVKYNYPDETDLRRRSKYQRNNLES